MSNLSPIHQALTGDATSFQKAVKDSELALQAWKSKSQQSIAATQKAFAELDGTLNKAEQAQKQLAVATGMTVKQQEAAARALDRIESRYNATYRIQTQLRNAEDQLNRAVAAGIITREQATIALDRYNAASVQTGTVLRNKSAVMQQVGYQVGDLATQIGMGQNALIAFSVQGAQLLGVFGGVGAILGAALAIIGPLAASFLKARDSINQTDEALQDLTRGIEAYEKSQNKVSDLTGDLFLANVKLTEALEMQNIAGANLARDEIERLEKQISLNEELIDLSRQRARVDLATAQAAVSALKFPVAIRRTETSTVELPGTAGMLTPYTETVTRIRSQEEILADQQELIRQTQERADAGAILTRQERQILDYLNRELEAKTQLIAAQERLNALVKGSEAGPFLPGGGGDFNVGMGGEVYVRPKDKSARPRQDTTSYDKRVAAMEKLNDLASSFYEKQLSAEKDITGQIEYRYQERNREANDAYANAIRLGVSVSEAEKARDAALAASRKAYEADIHNLKMENLDKELDAFLDQVKQEAAARKKIEDQYASLQARYMSPEEQAKQQKDADFLIAEQARAEGIIQTDEELYAERERIYQRYVDNLKKIDQQREAAAQVHKDRAESYIAQEANFIVNTLKGMVDESSGLYKLLFAAQQAAAIANTIVSTEAAAAKAMEYIPPPANLVYANVIRGLGYASAGIIAGTTIAGFAEGGYTGHGGKYEAAGVVHRGEYVFDAQTTRAIGVGNLDAMRKSVTTGGMGKPANDNGEQMVKVQLVLSDDLKAKIASTDQKIIEIETVAMSAPERAEARFVESLDRGGMARDAIERNYGLSRAFGA